jgi:hypothetical protein
MQRLTGYQQDPQDVKLATDLGPAIQSAMTAYALKPGAQPVPTGADLALERALAEAKFNAGNGGVNYGPLDSLGRPTGVSATITEDMLGTGTGANPSIKPPGFKGGFGTTQARGHLLGRQLGGSGDEVRNLVTMLQNPANSPVMRGFENAAAAAVRAGETLSYSAVPMYQGVNAIPRGITIVTSGSGGFQQSVTVLNPIH